MLRELSLPEKIEGVLFYKAVPVSVSTLQSVFDVDEAVLGHALNDLTNQLSIRGINLVRTKTTVTLATAPELDSLIEQLRKDELKRDIGKAGAETLAIVLYRGPVSRADIDRIRGVNSAYIVRSLQTRGLIERHTTGRQPTFVVTTDLMRHLGISHQRELPEYASTLDALDRYEMATQRPETAL